MLFGATLLVDLSAMAITLWMAFYLFGRGFPSRVTLRVVIILLALSVFFFSAYNNIFQQRVGTAAWRAVLIVIGQGIWYSLTYRLMSARGQARYGWMRLALYTLGGITVLLLITVHTAFFGEQGNALYVAHMGGGLPFTLYGIFQLLAALGMLHNLLADNRVGLTPQGKYFLAASVFPVFAVGYGVFSLASATPMPRLIQDLLIFGGVFLLGISVARHQTLVERRTTWQDFPLSALMIFGLATLYALIALRLGFSQQAVAFVVAFAIVTHSIYDLTRELLERQRIRHESAFRQQLRQIEGDNVSEARLRLHLQEGLDLLCQTLKTSSGFIAVRRGDDFIVLAARQSFPVGSPLPRLDIAFDDLIRPDVELLPNIVWFAPVFEGQTKIAIVGIGNPKSNPDHSSGNLDLLAEFADRVGIIVSLSSERPIKTEQVEQLVSEISAETNELSTIEKELLAATIANLDPEFIKAVEDGLRHLSDSIELGQSSLAERVGASGESHVERGQKLQRFLIDSIESLRPPGARPREPLPRLWYNYAVLYDAYVEGVPNREIMARLYISEGTFNRTRRNALRGFARLILETYETALKTK
jgi:hypothetical protein